MNSTYVQFIYFTNWGCVKKYGKHSKTSISGIFINFLRYSIVDFNLRSISKIFSLLTRDDFSVSKSASLQ